MFYATVAALGAVLFLFAWLGLRARFAGGDLDDYVTARDSQGASTLGLSFLASGMGAWILFAPPEVGAYVGPIALAGYAVGAALPFLVFALCGSAIRQRLPRGRSIGEFTQSCYGTGMRQWVALVSVFYMLCFLSAELTAIGAITGLLSTLPGGVTVVGVAVVTLAYTALGGLRASLVTDRWQALLLLVLLALVGLVVIERAPELAADATVPSVPLGNALGVALALVIAVTVANLFHQGYWQRVWAARDGAALGRGAVLGGVTTIVVVAVIGGLGILAAMTGIDLGKPPIPFFALLALAPPWVTVTALVLAVTLVASSVDTLQNGIASLAVTEGGGRVSLTAARWITVVLMIPVVALALQGVSVLRLFLIADLLCATTVLPVLLGLWPRMTTAAAVSGAVTGLIGAVLPGWIATGGFMAGLHAASFPGGEPTLGPFAGALVASTLVSVAVALMARRRGRPAPARDR